MVRGEAFFRRSHPHREPELRLLSSGLQHPAAGVRMFLPRQPHLPRLHRHEPLLPVQGPELLELLLQELGPRRDDRPQ